MSFCLSGNTDGHFSLFHFVEVGTGAKGDDVIGKG